MTVVDLMGEKNGFITWLESHLNDIMRQGRNQTMSTFYHRNEAQEGFQQTLFSQK